MNRRSEEERKQTKTRGLFKSLKILKRYLKTEGDLLSLRFQRRKPLVRVGVKNSQ